MPKVLVAGGTLKCSHQGTAKLPKGDSRLQVSSKAAVTAGMEVGLPFPDCPLKNPGTAAPSPCTATVAALPAGVSKLLSVGGAGVLLDSATGQATNPSDPSATWSVADAGQTLLSVDH